MQNEETQSQSNQWQQEIKDLATKLTTAMKDGDIDVVMSCFWDSPDFIMVNSNGTITRGWDNMKTDVEQLITSTKWREITPESISSFHHGDAVYSVGKAKWKFQLKDGPLVEFREVWTDVAKVIDGNWVYMINHPHDLTPFTP